MGGPVYDRYTELKFYIRNTEPKMNLEKFRGVFPPVPTIVDGEGRLDRAGMAKLIDKPEVHAVADDATLRLQRARAALIA